MATEADSPAEDSTPRIKVNAHARLHQLLVKFTKAGQEQLVSRMLVSCMGLTETDESRAALQASAILYKMIEAANREVEFYLPTKTNFYLAALQEVRVALVPHSWFQQWAQRRAALKDTSITAIHFTAERLEELVPESEMTSQELGDISMQLDEFAVALDDLNLSPATLLKLKQRVAKLRNALEEYGFWGVDQIEVQFDALVGAWAPMVERTPEGKIKPVWERMKNHLVTISGYIATATSSYKTIHEGFLLAAPYVEPAIKQIASTAKAIEGVISSS